MNIHRQAGSPSSQGRAAPPAAAAITKSTSSAMKMPVTMASCCSEPSRPRMWAGVEVRLARLDRAVDHGGIEAEEEAADGGHHRDQADAPARAGGQLDDDGRVVDGPHAVLHVPRPQSQPTPDRA